MKNAITLPAPNNKPAFVVIRETGNLVVVSKEDAVLFMESAINNVRKASGTKYIEFKKHNNTHLEAEIDYLVYTIENRLIKALEPKLGFLPQDISAIRTIITHVCNRDHALRGAQL